jgi:hypothetical protein
MIISFMQTLTKIGSTLSAIMSLALLCILGLLVVTLPEQAKNIAAEPEDFYLTLFFTILSLTLSLTFGGAWNTLRRPPTRSAWKRLLQVSLVLHAVVLGLLLVTGAMDQGFASVEVMISLPLLVVAMGDFLLTLTRPAQMAVPDKSQTR